MADITKRPLYQIIDGIRCPAAFSPVCFKEALEYKPRPDDVLVVTYPKCGTTWMQNIMLHIFRKGEPLDHPLQFLSAAPFIDMVGEEGVRKMTRPGGIKTHLPYTHMPYSPEAKYIFVTRDPKDACVSLYYHTRMFLGYGYSDGLFDDFFELFMAGEVEYNDYFDHLLSWFPHRNDNNVFYTTYEKMKQDTQGLVLRLAHFLGEEYGSFFEKDNTALNNVLKFSNFRYMKENFSDLYDSYAHRDLLLNDPDTLEGLKCLARFTCSLELPAELPKMEFIRKGVVGDWKSHLSTEQYDRLEKKFEEKNESTNIKSLWTD